MLLTLPVLAAAPGRIVFRVQAHTLQGVLEARSRREGGTLPGAAGGCAAGRRSGTVGAPTFSIEFLGAGVQVYSFTFG